MKIRLLTQVIICAVFMISCKKDEELTTIQKPVKLSSKIIAPVGFTWENSRNVNFTINVLNNKSQSTIHVVSIFDGDPKTGGAQITKGSATTIEPFKCKIYLPNHITDVFVVGMFPNGSIITKKVSITNLNLSLSIGL
jgi:hypothetical protein